MMAVTPTYKYGSKIKAKGKGPYWYQDRKGKWHYSGKDSGGTPAEGAPENETRQQVKERIHSTVVGKPTEKRGETGGPYAEGKASQRRPSVQARMEERKRVAGKHWKSRLMKQYAKKSDQRPVDVKSFAKDYGRAIRKREGLTSKIKSLREEAGEAPSEIQNTKLAQLRERKEQMRATVQGAKSATQGYRDFKRKKLGQAAQAAAKKRYMQGKKMRESA